MSLVHGSAVLVVALTVVATASAETASEGVVRAVDRSAGKVVLRHGPIENLGIPPMTMVFRVKDTRALEKLESGTKVRFNADRVEGTFLITHIERRESR